ncbi:MAG: energy transducer TonB [bacterium]|jgi:TonB family protein
MKRISIRLPLLFSLMVFITAAGISQSTRMKKPELKAFLQMHMEYPAAALDRGEQGTVKISFVTNEQGEVTSRKITAGVSDKVDSAALQLFDLILWQPAEEYGVPVAGQGEFKIKYHPGKYHQMVRKRGYDRIPLAYEPADRSGKIYTVKELDEAPSALLDTIYPDVSHFLAGNLVYPEQADKLAISGVVKLRFVIETNGLPSNIMIIDPVGAGCTEEAIRVVELITWRPGIKDRKAVRTCYNMSITFDPADELRNKYIPNQTNTGI